MISLFPNINIEQVELESIVPERLTDGGIITGIPTDKLAADSQMEIQIDHLCRGMQGEISLDRVFYVILRQVLIRLI